MEWIFLFPSLIVVFALGAVVTTTIQGKMAGGMSRLEAYKELFKELFGLN
jgi:hypothetical protein